MLVIVCLHPDHKSKNLVTVSFLKFSSKYRWYAIKQMGIAPAWLGEVQGCDFYKLMGSGAGKGFSIFPDFSTYCLLMNWKEQSDMESFFENNKEWIAYENNAEASFRLELEAVKVHGQWNGQNPFTIEGDLDQGGKIVVLTRATIKKRFIPFFWSKVPKASRPVQGLAGHIFSKGVGEVPLLHQATISVWKSREAMHKYAYEHNAHLKMIKMTRDKGWYSEEMFSEFNVTNIVGEIW